MEKDSYFADVKEMFAESKLEHDRQIKEWREENDRQMKEWREENDRMIKNMSRDISGISGSNGKFAEEYFYNSLERTLEFGGVHFDDISRKFGYLKKMPDGSRLQDQFDIVMLNGDSVALIEIKYKARNEDVKELVNKKIHNFRILFSEYAKHKIYLGLGGMSFEENVPKEAKELGIGLLKQVGETIEYETEWVRAY